MTDIRILDTMSQYEQAVDVEIAVWGVDPRECIPTSFMRANQAAGGVNLGAFHGDRMIGFCIGFPGLRDGRIILWSAIAGVLPEYQGQSVGANLKVFQFDWARANGFSEVRWTYDPLQAGNAHFNLHILGATANVYHVNFYGVMNDAINKGLETDRVEAAVSMAEPYSLPRRGAFQGDALDVLHVGADGLPQRLDFRDAPVIRAAMPQKIRQLDPQAKHVWRIAVRETLQHYFARGYSAVDIVRETTSSAYILRK
ncbi:MAG: hypothetical protein KME04_01600 [Pleurocapsa minor GSE-CHR-MK-17-07R]|nr:hypothetical protein [Pleurocapsa minor GSE-CHR-MK 17-07R]